MTEDPAHRKAGTRHGPGPSPRSSSPWAASTRPRAGPEEDTRGGFEQGGWSFTYGDDDFGRFVSDVFARAGAFLLSRVTHDNLASYRPKATDPADPIAGRLNAPPKYVPSAALTDPGRSGATVLTSGLAEEATALEERVDGELQVHGSGALVRSLPDLGLVGTLHLATFPVVLGSGRRLFTEGAEPTAFTHTAGRVTAGGVSVQSCAPSGRPRYGAYELPDA